MRRAAEVMASCGRDGEQHQQRGRDGGMTVFLGFWVSDELRFFLRDFRVSDEWRGN